MDGDQGIMGVIIQKFGGTSLASIEGRESVMCKIIEAKNQGNQVVVVVSAMGRSGAPYATDTLMGLLEPAGHYASNRELDLLISCGEIISTVVLSNSLKSKGMASEALSGGQSGILTSSHFTEAVVTEVNGDRIRGLLSQNIIPVVAGFQGRDASGEITTLGRGGSDTTAALLGEAIRADAVEIYTDVDGIMTADPNVCHNASIIDVISYDEVFQMADNGAKVIHPRAVEVARRSGIPMLIKNTFTNNKGTSITNYNSVEKPITLSDQLITSIAHRPNRIQFTVEGTLDDEVFFNELAKEGVSIDIINIFPGRRVFTTETSMRIKTISIIEKYEVAYSFIDHCCKVTVIGEKMTGIPGVMAKIISSLAKVDVQILQTADSLSTIACLVHKEDQEKAVIALHNTFGLSRN